LKLSVPSPTAQATFAATLVDEWIRHGVTEAVICPGSRSTPIALAIFRRTELTVHVRVDERSAAFFALGCARRTGQPVIVAVTSGTAAVELHAAVAEADLGHVPLLVVTADRPPELHGVGAAQTLRQRDLFGPMVRCFEEPGVARGEASASWRPLASRLYRFATGDLAGPVHLNAAFVDPLVGVAGPLPEPRASGPWTVVEADVTPITVSVPSGRVLAVVGPSCPKSFLAMARRCGWPVVGDATAAGVLAHADVIVRDTDIAKRLAPEVVVRAGAMPASKVLAQRLVEWAPAVIALTTPGVLVDPDGLVTRVVPVPRDAPLASLSIGDPAYLALWEQASAIVGELAVTMDAASTSVSEPSVARLAARLSGELNAPLVVGSSMPVRDVEWWADARTGVTIANRGANGIDGVVSTVFGVAAGRSAIGLVGDVTFLHDVSALVDGLGRAGGRCALIVADNQGGGIFNFLPQAESLDRDEFTTLFATPHDLDLVAVATSFGHRATRVDTNGALDEAVRTALDGDGVTVIVAAVPLRDDNVQLHEELNVLASELLRERL
jgi:2-succinyl-5-enolpyruvyl-6-hydroxy-3-cyclohexene-1-carboxylate synthase